MVYSLNNRGGFSELAVDTLKAIIIYLPFILLLLPIAIYFNLSHTPSQLFVFLLYSGALCVYVSFYFKKMIFTIKSGSSSILQTVVLQVLIPFCLSALLSIILEGITIYGSPAASLFIVSNWSKKRLVFFFLLSFCAFSHVIQSGAAGKPSSEPRDWYLDNFLNFGFLFFISIAALIGYQSSSKIVTVLVLIISIFANIIFIFFKKCEGLPVQLEYIFAGIALTFGFFFALTFPITTGISWDDEIHFQRAVELSYVVSPKISETELSFVNDVYLRPSDVSSSEDANSNSIPSVRHWNSESNKTILKNRNDMYEQDMASGSVVSTNAQPLFSLNSFGYIPSAIGLWLGRALHLEFSTLVIIGRLFNLLFYVVVFSFAIRIAPTKKIVFLVCGLIPTSLFMSANYSYDPWICSFLALGIAFYLRAFWSDASNSRHADIVYSLFFVFIAIAVKAVYFPILGIYLTAPKVAFDNCSSKNKYYGLVVFVGILLLSSFALPYLFTVNTDAGDLRGGNGINPSDQIKFILSSPAGYVGILCNFFVTTYLNPVFSNQFTLHFAYLGFATFNTGIAILDFLFLIAPAGFLILVGLLSGDSAGLRNLGFCARLWTVFVLLCSLVLVATALYVSFTPVRCSTINGCQFRYILPCLVPLLVLGLNVSKLGFGNSATFKGISIFICIAELGLVTFQLCISCIV